METRPDFADLVTAAGEFDLAAITRRAEFEFARYAGSRSAKSFEAWLEIAWDAARGHMAEFEIRAARNTDPVEADFAVRRMQAECKTNHWDRQRALNELAVDQAASNAVKAQNAKQAEIKARLSALEVRASLESLSYSKTCAAIGDTERAVEALADAQDWIEQAVRYAEPAAFPLERVK